MRTPDAPTPLLVSALLILALGGPAAAAPASAADQEAAKALVSRTVDDVLGILRDEGLDEAQKRERIQELAYERFDFEIISRLVLARSWRSMSPVQRKEFEAEFKRHLSVTYGDNLDRYGEERVQITDTRSERNGDVTVRTRILGQGDPIAVDYRLRSRNGAWYVIDVIIENVSLLSNFRSQTQEIISTEGADGLIQKLREKNDAREG